MMTEKILFDEWPERYEQWFTTPIGKLVKEIEGELIHELLNPRPKEMVLDAGCGTGIFALDFLAVGAQASPLSLAISSIFFLVNLPMAIYLFNLTNKALQRINERGFSFVVNQRNGTLFKPKTF